MNFKSIFPNKNSNATCLVMLFFIFFNTIVSAQEQSKLDGVQVAFLSDVHLQDLFGKFSDSDYRGILNPKTWQYTLLRTMASQLHSTRIFNENYFAFIA